MSLVVRADEKVFQNGQYLFGFTSSFRMGQLLRYSLSPPQRDPSTRASRFMATTFIDAVRDVLKSGGYAQKKDDIESAGTFIVGYEGRLFVIEDDYQVAEPAVNFAAVGCGAAIALGALFATKSLRISPRRRLLNALAASERFSAGVRRPFITRSLKTRQTP
jgi:hypothetical protein